MVSLHVANNAQTEDTLTTVSKFNLFPKGDLPKPPESVRKEANENENMTEQQSKKTITCMVQRGKLQATVYN